MDHPHAGGDPQQFPWRAAQPVLFDRTETWIDNRRIFQPRGKVIGGSLSLNGMVFVSGHREDFNQWEATGAEGWSYKDVLPHFRAMETCLRGGDAYRGDAGPISVSRMSRLHPMEQAFLEAVDQAGYGMARDYTGADQDGGNAFDVNIAKGERSATAALIGCILSRPNLTVLTGAHITRLLMEGGRVTGAAFIRKGTEQEARFNADVILSVGAVQSPQILMLSGIGPAEQLQSHCITVRHDLPGFGENLHDHLEVHIKLRSAAGTSRNSLLKPERKAAIGLQWFLSRTGPTATTPSKVGAFLRTAKDVSYPDIQYNFWPYYLDGWSPPPQQRRLLLRRRTSADGKPRLGKAGGRRPSGAGDHAAERAARGNRPQGVPRQHQDHPRDRGAALL